MPTIQLLDQQTIDKIAAGEVVERPSSVVKELVENAIDANATAVTVEIKEGGISFIRITDNGCGMEKEQIPLAFLRHSTSKIKSVEDLLRISSLGFRGEALSSIAAVAQVEVITKTYRDLTGTRYIIEGSKEISSEEIGAPEGTTFLVKNLFFNTPVRRKFLKTPQTEGNYIADLIERMALSHPNISFKFINNGQTKLHTSGNGSKKDLIYHIFGRDITSSLIAINEKTQYFEIDGFIGKPNVSRGNRNYENYFINGRYVKSNLISKSIEDGYRGFLMQHQYPFCVLYLSMNSELLDVNVHPTKMELRFMQNEEIYKTLYEITKNAVAQQEFIQQVPIKEEKKQNRQAIVKEAPEPFEVRRLAEEKQNNVNFFTNRQGTENSGFLNERKLNNIRNAVSVDSPYEPKYKANISQKDTKTGNAVFERLAKRPMETLSKTGNETNGYTLEQNYGNRLEIAETNGFLENNKVYENIEVSQVYEQQKLDSLDTGFLTETARKKHKIIGQLFDTYWLIEYEEKLFIIDQHAAHEKVLYEQTMEKLKSKSFASQAVSPPIILTLNNEEEAVITKYKLQFQTFGYEIEPFGGKEYAITAIPADFMAVDMKSMFLDLLSDFTALGKEQTPILILEKVASMSCKAAVKAHDKLSFSEAEHLIDTLLTLENPYQCPHGRPTIISMTRYELEKKFKRIV